MRRSLFLRRRTLRVLAVGGGPGCEGVALAAVAHFVGSASPVEIIIADCETAWERTARAVHEAARAVTESGAAHVGHNYTRGKCCGGPGAPVTLRFLQADVTRGLADASNAQLAAEVRSGVDLVLFSYVLVETAAAARRGGWRFVRDCANSLRGADAYMIALDASHRLWPEMIDVLRTECPQLRAWLPRNVSRKVALLASFSGGGGGGGGGGDVGVGDEGERAEIDRADGTPTAHHIAPERMAVCEAAAVAATRARMQLEASDAKQQQHAAVRTFPTPATAAEFDTLCADIASTYSGRWACVRFIAGRGGPPRAARVGGGDGGDDEDDDGGGGGDDGEGCGMATLAARGAPAAGGHVADTPTFHASRDFCWDDVRAEFEPIIRERARAAATAATDAAAQIAGWQTHFERHEGQLAHNPFFKERRYLLQQFPLLRTGPMRILEIGCGNGSSCLPILRGNPQAHVHASDPSPAAVEQTRRYVELQGLSSRLTVEVQPAPAQPCAASAGPFDAVMAVFTLSAVPGEDDRGLLAACARMLRPGGVLYIRDYGVFDMRHMSDARSARLLATRQTAYEYVRPGGMYRRYYSLERIDELAAAAGLVVEESRYLLNRLRNEKRDLTMNRVYVHALLRKPARGGAGPGGA